MVLHGQRVGGEALTPRSLWREAPAGGLRACQHSVVHRPAWRRRDEGAKVKYNALLTGNSTQWKTET